MWSLFAFWACSEKLGACALVKPLTWGSQEADSKREPWTNSALQECTSPSLLPPTEAHPLKLPPLPMAHTLCPSMSQPVDEVGSLVVQPLPTATPLNLDELGTKPSMQERLEDLSNLVQIHRNSNPIVMLLFVEFDQRMGGISCHSLEPCLLYSVDLSLSGVTLPIVCLTGPRFDHNRTHRLGEKRCFSSCCLLGNKHIT